MRFLIRRNYVRKKKKTTVKAFVFLFLFFFFSLSLSLFISLSLLIFISLLNSLISVSLFSQLLKTCLCFVCIVKTSLAVLYVTRAFLDGTHWQRVLKLHTGVASRVADCQSMLVSSALLH